MKLFDVLVAFAGLSLLLLAGITLRRKLRWDPVQWRFVGDDEANRLRSRACRQPWQV